jgi:pilus assembly protein CpaB
MNNKAMSLSLIMAGIAVWFVMSSVSSIEDEAKKKFGEEVTVLVAKSDIKEMDTILDTMIEPRQVPQRFVEPTAIAFNAVVGESAKEYEMEIKKIIGSVSIVPIKKGEQIALNKITEPNMRTGLAPQVAPGKRAISIPASEIESVSKLVKPGDRVDMIAVIDLGSGAGGRENKVAKTILQDVVVLAVGRNITNNIARRVDPDGNNGKVRVRSLTEYDGFSSLTIEVDPAQAQLIAAITASSSNKIILSLRNNDDTDRLNLSSVRANDAIGNGESRMPAQNQGQQSPSGGK